MNVTSLTIRFRGDDGKVHSQTWDMRGFDFEMREDIGHDTMDMPASHGTELRHVPTGARSIYIKAIRPPQPGVYARAVKKILRELGG